MTAANPSIEKDDPFNDPDYCLEFLVKHPQLTLANKPEISDWVRYDRFLEDHTDFEDNQVRWLLMHRKKSGLDKCVRKIGRWIYINKHGFLKWIENYPC